MIDIPADVMQAAYDCARGIYLNVDDAGAPYLTGDDIEEIAKAILAEREQNIAINGWEPIETAPKDRGQHVLLWNGRRAYEGYWGLGAYNRSTREYERAWVSSPNSVATKPTHWMPLPVGPTKKGTTP